MWIGAGVTIIVCAVLLSMYSVAGHLKMRYRELESVAIKDRNGSVLTLVPNARGAYVEYRDTIPARVQELLIKKEDRFFFLHPGVNPLSILRSMARYITGHRSGGASTITQQLVKNLLGHADDRSVVNKIIEVGEALSLEMFASKADILRMYENTVYMGNQTQGLHNASELYFNKPLEDLDDTKISMLLATLSSPSRQNPWRDENATASRNVAVRIGVAFDPHLAIVTTVHDYVPPHHLELASMHQTCTSTCTTTLDADLTRRLRTMLKSRVERGFDAGARSGAIVVLKLPENELLAIVGTPDTESHAYGQQINMAIQPRPIGSTAKPFIYLKGFEKGLRPYTLVNDREYTFPLENGFPFYPKNYDGLYRGWITLHTALSNSLNIPSVKVLEYVGLNHFYDFLKHDMGFVPLKDLDTYQYGIALGALDMDPLTLAHYLSIFPLHGVLKPVRLFLDGTTTPTIATPMSPRMTEKKITTPELAALVTSVLHDRLTGVEQFGLSSSLNLSQSNYAVKTGTSQDYHDSWTVGYTPDFLVVVWYGNPDNTALKHVTGQSGAGGVWHDAMELLMNTPYNKRTPLDTSLVHEVEVQGSLDFALWDDVITEHQNLLQDTALITSPHDGDTFLKESQTRIPLISSEDVTWYSNDEYLGSGSRMLFTPNVASDYTIKALTRSGKSSLIHIHVIDQR
jgi:penicillin-binding protein 1C